MVGHDERGHQVFEWVHDIFRLAIFVDDGQLTYVKSWGSNILDEMEDGVIQSTEQLEELIQWVKTSNRNSYEKRSCFGDPYWYDIETIDCDCHACIWKKECGVAVVTGAR